MYIVVHIRRLHHNKINYAGVWFGKNKKILKMGSRPGSPFGVEDKAPELPGCLILEDLQTLHIPTNKKLEVWTQLYRPLLSFFGGYFSSFKKIL